MNRTIHALIGDIIQCAAREFCVPRVAILNESRLKSVAEARRCAMAVARQLTRFSYPELGRAFERDHSTVIAAVRSASRSIQNDKGFAFAMQNVMKQSKAMLEARAA